MRVRVRVRVSVRVRVRARVRVRVRVSARVRATVGAHDEADHEDVRDVGHAGQVEVRRVHVERGRLQPAVRADGALPLLVAEGQREHLVRVRVRVRGWAEGFG